jgi:hypothetical protein
VVADGRDRRAWWARPGRCRRHEPCAVECSWRRWARLGGASPRAAGLARVVAGTGSHPHARRVGHGQASV